MDNQNRENKQLNLDLPITPIEMGQNPVTQGHTYEGNSISDQEYSDTSEVETDQNNNDDFPLSNIVNFVIKDDGITSSQLRPLSQIKNDIDRIGSSQNSIVSSSRKIPRSVKKSNKKLHKKMGRRDSQKSMKSVSTIKTIKDHKQQQVKDSTKIKVGSSLIVENPKIMSPTRKNLPPVSPNVKETILPPLSVPVKEIVSYRSPLISQEQLNSLKAKMHDSQLHRNLYYQMLNNYSRELVGQTYNSHSKDLKEQPLVINVCFTQYEVLQDAGEETGFELSNDEEEDWDVWWIDGPILPTLIHKMKWYQRVSHLPAVQIIARKNCLAKNLGMMQKLMPNSYNFFPQTWVLPADAKSFKEQFNGRRAKTFIIKPEFNCQGIGIFLTRNYEWAQQGEHYVAQKYLHKPLLIEGLKFDLRIYILVTGLNPLRCFIYKEGLARFATEIYKGPNGVNLNNLCMHLTNYAINKEAYGYQANSDEKKDNVGHKRSITSILNHIDSVRDEENGLPSSDQVWQEIKEVCAKTLFASVHGIEHLYRSSKPADLENSICFQIFGFDVMLDHKCKPWLIEVNHSPSFTTDSPLDFKIKKNVIRDTLHILNLSQKRKQKYLNSAKNEQEKRLVDQMKLNMQQRQQQKQELKQKKLKQKDQFENSNMGDFQNLYPLPRGVTAEQDKLMDYYDLIYYKKSKQMYDESLAGGGAAVKKKEDLPALDLNKKKDTNLRSSIITNSQSTPHRFDRSPRKFDRKEYFQQSIQNIIKPTLPDESSVQKISIEDQQNQSQIPLQDSRINMDGLMFNNLKNYPSVFNSPQASSQMPQLSQNPDQKEDPRYAAYNYFKQVNNSLQNSRQHFSYKDKYLHARMNREMAHFEVMEQQRTSKTRQSNAGQDLLPSTRSSDIHYHSPEIVDKSKISLVTQKQLKTQFKLKKATIASYQRNGIPASLGNNLNQILQDMEQSYQRQQISPVNKVVHKSFHKMENNMMNIRNQKLKPLSPQPQLALHGNSYVHPYQQNDQ